MINIQYLTEKAALNKSAKETLLLLELEGIKKAISKTTKRQKLNLSLVIDVSGSMSEGVGRMNVNNDFPTVCTNSLQTNIFDKRIQQIDVNNFFNRGIARITKMELVKKAAIKAVEGLKDGDFISLVVFNQTATLSAEAMKVTKESKLEMINKISMLSANGGTNLHSGWVSGVTEVIKNIKDKYINRVLILTDGETISGKTDINEISKDVAAIYKNGVTTSTFGVGDSFNEKLLQSMSDNGGGNFYYIKNENEFDQMFAEEFTGMANIAGSEVELKLELKEGFKVIEQMNQYEAKEGVYNLANVLSGNKLSVLFKIETNIGKDVKIADIGEVFLKYKDENGNKIEQTIKLESDVLTEKKWDKLPVEQEVKIQETLLIIAKNKLEAANQIANGNIEDAKGILRGASASLSASGLDDARIGASLNSLATTLASADTMNAREFSKTMHYESYKFRSGKDQI